jgi:hypothetical protein
MMFIMKINYRYNSSVNQRSAGIDLAINARVTLLDLEEAIVSPWGAPWVSAEPVVKARSGIQPITKALDGVTTSLASGLVIVDTTLVVEEVFIDGEGELSWAIVVELSLDGWNCKRVGDKAWLALVLQPGLTWASACSSALAWVTTTRCVWPAGLSDDTRVHKVWPNCAKVPTIAAVVVIVTRDGILRSEDNIFTTNAESVRESLSGTESPTWAALLLVSDGMNTFSGEFGSITGVEVSGKGTNWGNLLCNRCVVVVVKVCADEVQELLSGHITKRVGLGVVDLPRNGSSKLIDKLVSDGVLLGSGEGSDCSCDDEFEHVF